ncbi:MAG: undecaprenyl-diphosphate phosphatase [Micavibrio sp.]|nr:MAG: undecaprenyl-diphosphate phosphatase [Micavibrio sp.]
MTFWHLFLLSVVQGITEFLPVSSSAHLVLFPHLAGTADQGIIIDLAVHVGSLLAVILVFRKDIFDILKTALHYKAAPQKDKNLLAHILIACIPVLIVGMAVHCAFPDGIRNIVLIGWISIIFALLLWAADRFGATDKTVQNVTRKDAFIIGLLHILALIPGVSRSGITMTTARALGMSRVEAARFSLLIGIPVIAGAGFLGFLALLNGGSAALGFDALLAVVLSFAASYLAIVLMLRWLKNSTFLPFVLYRLCFGAAILLFFV